ncbi:natural cytotoxicity triggering receptor 3-like isoform X2 [Lissotriton helveticus]
MPKLPNMNPEPVGALLQVSQPSYINVTVGDTVVLECSYYRSGNSVEASYKWLFTNTTTSSYSLREIEVSSTSQQFSGRVFKSDNIIVTSQQEAKIEIQNVRHDDAGTYICEVELFMVTNGKGRGNGTRLQVLEVLNLEPLQRDYTVLNAVRLVVAALLLSFLLMLLWNDRALRMKFHLMEDSELTNVEDGCIVDSKENNMNCSSVQSSTGR